MDTFDKENCMNLYNVCAGFVNKWLPDDQEIARLKALDLSYIDKLPDWMKEAIAEMQRIDEEANTPKVEAAPLQEEVTEATDTEEKSEDIAVATEETVEVKTEEKPTAAKSEHKFNTKNKPKYYTKNK